ncbi:MAG: ABC transporter permease [Pirellulaceae bacterium]|nr:ABC transporter permease [Pirellulaceae bacterium]
MYFVSNPVLQRELLVNLRTMRSFMLFAIYQILILLIIYLAWPSNQQVDMIASTAASNRLVDLFFMAQYVLIALMTPSFASGAISGEKERKSYEMLLASPLRPTAIVIGKLVASLTHLAILLITSIPIIVVCLPRGGISFYEVLGAYVVLITSVLLFGMISVFCSSLFTRTASSLVVSYMAILPIALGILLMWNGLSENGYLRLIFAVLLPCGALGLGVPLFWMTTRKMIHPPDIGSEGQQVIDLEQENEKAVGMVIDRTKFPDRFFVPPERKDLMSETANPVLEKEMHHEIFGQGMLMLRLTIQIGMLLVIPIMAAFLYFMSEHVGWYISYVLLYNMLISPVFLAGSITSERERQTLDLLLTTLITPWQILWGKFVAGFRVGGYLTLLVLWPLALSVVLLPFFHVNFLSILAYLGIIGVANITCSLVALFASTHMEKTSGSLLLTYMLVLVLFCVPPAVEFFVTVFYQDSVNPIGIDTWRSISPFSTVFSVPLDYDGLVSSSSYLQEKQSWISVGYFFLFHGVFNAVLYLALYRRFVQRWRVSQSH